MAVSSLQRRLLSGRKRRGIVLWLAEHAWQLSGLTALTSSTSFFIAVTCSFSLRPRRPYFFPLLSDVSSYDPEKSILHSGFMLSTVLLLATTVACWKRAAMLEENCEGGVEDGGDGGDDNVGLVRRKTRRFGVTSAVILMFSVLVLGTFARSFKIVKIVSGVLTAKRLDTIAFYGLAFVWFSAISYLTWFFFKLETISDHDTCDVEADTEAYDNLRLRYQESYQSELREKIHRMFLRLILYLRPLCFTGQVVCLVKIAGLRLALNRFNISKKPLIRLALQTALSFTEYTGAFFFSFFMIMLMIDMRKKFRQRQDVREIPISMGELGSPMVRSPMAPRSPACR